MYVDRERNNKKKLEQVVEHQRKEKAKKEERKKSWWERTNLPRREKQKWATSYKRYYKDGQFNEHLRVFEQRQKSKLASGIGLKSDGATLRIDGKIFRRNAWTLGKSVTNIQAR